MTSAQDESSLRRAMVRQQLVKRGIRDGYVLESMSRLPRHLFVPGTQSKYAYEDGAVSVGWGATISQPYMVARMTEWLECNAEDTVLEIGTGSGYQAALLAGLVKKVFTIERVPELSESAKARCEALGITNIEFRVGDGSAGWPAHGPYDAIMVTAGAPEVPTTLLNQLKVGGRIVCPIGDRKSQLLVKLTRSDDGFVREEDTSCRFVPLIGKEGWSE